MSHDPFFPNCTGLSPPGYLVFDCESIPDGKLLNIVKYPTETLTPEEACPCPGGSEGEFSGKWFRFLAGDVPDSDRDQLAARNADFSLQAMTCLDASYYRPRTIIDQFWAGLVNYHRAVSTAR